jgi:hypothetical protein
MGHKSRYEAILPTSQNDTSNTNDATALHALRAQGEGSFFLKLTFAAEHEQRSD